MTIHRLVEIEKRRTVKRRIVKWRTIPLRPCGG
jgi:hypothetical protein